MASSLSDINTECLDILAQLACSYCDPDVSTGRTTGLCSAYCENLYAACADIFIDPYAQSQSYFHHLNFPLCKPDSSIICSKATDYIDSPNEFCQALGFELQDHDDEFCFRGEEKVGFKYEKLPRSSK